MDHEINHQLTFIFNIKNRTNYNRYDGVNDIYRMFISMFVCLFDTAFNSFESKFNKKVSNSD